MTADIAPLLVREPVDYSGLSFFDVPSPSYAALVGGMADENRWHFEENTTESHMAFLREWGPRLVKWSSRLPFPQGSVHLDLGAGEGILSYLIAQRGYHSIAVELSATILHSATLFQAGLHGARRSKHSSMDLWVADIYKLPLKPCSVDFVTIKQVLHHLADLDGLLQEVSRVLKPNGVVYVWEPFFVSIPLLRGYFLKRTRPLELSRGIHHVHHTYWTYQRLLKRWLTALSIQREFKSGKLQYYATRNRFTNGAIYAEGTIKPCSHSSSKTSERLQIQPKDFLREDLITEGLQTTRFRKEFLDSLLAEGASSPCHDRSSPRSQELPC
jgi:ubiquinone/menaquinone biosynthesis C-methylase UbiE